MPFDFRTTLGYFKERKDFKMAQKIVYNHKAIEKKWQEKWEKDAFDCMRESLAAMRAWGFEA